MVKYFARSVNEEITRPVVRVFVNINVLGLHQRLNTGLFCMVRKLDSARHRLVADGVALDAKRLGALVDGFWGFQDAVNLRLGVVLVHGACLTWRLNQPRRGRNPDHPFTGLSGWVREIEDSIK